MCNKTGKKRKFDFNVQSNTTAVKKPTAAAGEDGQRTEMPSPWLTITWTNSLQNTMLNTTTNHNSIVILGTHNYLKITITWKSHLWWWWWWSRWWRWRLCSGAGLGASPARTQMPAWKTQVWWDFDDFDFYDHLTQVWGVHVEILMILNCDLIVILMVSLRQGFDHFAKQLFENQNKTNLMGFKEKFTYVSHGSYSTSIVRT